MTTENINAVLCSAGVCLCKHSYEKKNTTENTLKDLLQMLLATHSTGNLLFAYSYCYCFVLVVG